MQSGLDLPRLHTRQIQTSSVAWGRSPGAVTCCATTPSQTATHSSQMNADEPAMSCRTALCGVLQNEQRYSGLLKKSNNESSRFTHIVRSRQKEARDTAFASPVEQRLYAPCKWILCPARATDRGTRTAIRWGEGPYIRIFRCTFPCRMFRSHPLECSPLGDSSSSDQTNSPSSTNHPIRYSHNP